MRNPIKSLLIFFLATLVLCSCNTESSQKKEVNIPQNLQRIEVDTAKAIIAPFYKEYITNGVLKAKQDYQLISAVSGMLKSLSVVPGQNVREGDVIATLINKQLEVTLEEKKLKLDKSLVELDYFLIGHSYSVEDSNNIPKKIWNTGSSESGYDLAKIEYREAILDVENLSVKALFNGVVANIEILPGQQVSKGELICNLLDLSKLNCEFDLIEDDFLFVKIGQTVNIAPYASDKVFVGKIFAKNPEISEYGIFTVFAEIENSGRRLVHGMHAEVKILAGKKDQLIIPKGAVVSRNDDNIVFTYSEGKAIWNFVKILDENNEYVAISEGISEGDIVITQGNLFLNNDSPVKVKSKNSK